LKDMKIYFTKAQFENLLKIVYLGNWMANAIHNGTEEDPLDGGLEAIEHYVFAFAKDFGLENLVEYSKDFEQFFPTDAFDDLMIEYIDKYDEDCFWEELFYRMTDRDFERAYSNEEIEKMEMLELFEKQEPFRDKWDKEISERGIERLEINP